MQLKIKLSDFRLLTRSRTLPEPVDTAAPIASAARALLREREMRALIAESGARLLGVSIANLVQGTTEQLHLFGEVGPAVKVGEVVPEVVRTRLRDPAEDRKLTEAVDAIRSRFGIAAVGPATLAAGGRLRVKRPGDTQWGPNEDAEVGPRAES